MRVRDWKAAYVGGVYDAHTPPHALPRTGLVRIIEYLDPPYRRFVPIGDWYWFDGERWYSSGTGEWGTWLPKPCPEAIQSTVRLPQPVYDAICAGLMR